MVQKMDANIYSKMQTGEPYKTYKKTTLGRVAVLIINPFTGEPDEEILSGDPSKNEEGCFIHMWSDKEDAYFKRANFKHLQRGNLISIESKNINEPSKEELANVFTDDELKKLLNSRFLTLQSALNKMTSATPVYRLITFAKELEKSEKIIKVLEARVAELEGFEVESE